MKKDKINYPKTIFDLQKIFESEQACVEYLVKIRWPTGFKCDCGCKNPWIKRNGQLFECSICHKNYSPTSGTIMHASHLPIKTWFHAAYLVATLTPGISARQLQRQLGLGSYRTAWYMLGRLKAAMVNENREKLSGLVEVDEAFVGGVQRSKKRGFERDKPHNKALVAGAVEVLKISTKSGKSKEIAGRVRLEIVRSTDKESLKPFINKNIELGSRVRTDGLAAYKSKTLDGFRHIRRINRQDRIVKNQIHHIHRVFSNLKTWLNGTHHGVESKYLQIYLDEFVFRFNRRNNPMLAFKTLLGISMCKKPISLNKFKSRNASA